MKAPAKKRRKIRPTIMDAIIFGAFQRRVSIDQLVRALKLPREEIEQSIRRGVRW